MTPLAGRRSGIWISYLETVRFLQRFLGNGWWDTPLRGNPVLQRNNNLSSQKAAELQRKSLLIHIQSSIPLKMYMLLCFFYFNLKIFLLLALEINAFLLSPFPLQHIKIKVGAFLVAYSVFAKAPFCNGKSFTAALCSWQFPDKWVVSTDTTTPQW